MAFVDWLNVEEVDHAKPYKTFNDLKDGDNIYIVDFKQMEIRELKISDYKKKDRSDYKSKNLTEVEFKVNESYNTKNKNNSYCIGNSYVRISDGNQYFSNAYVDYTEVYYSTDSRIANIILKLLQYRNSYQWNCLTGIFGNPMGQYAHQQIKLC